MKQSLSDLRDGDVGEIKGRRFIVWDRVPEDRSSGYSTIAFEDGSRQTYYWDTEDPIVTKLGKGRLITRIEISDLESGKRP